MFFPGLSVWEISRGTNNNQKREFSICLYCEEDGVLFAGDTPLIIRRPGDTYPEEFVEALERLSQKDIRSIYFGHGQPILHNCNALLRNSLENVKQCVKV